MSRHEIRALVDAMGNIAAADPEDKAEAYRRLGTRLTYQPAHKTVRAEAPLTNHPWAFGSCPRGDLNPHAQ
jgi:site-specific DNA recombinase